MRRTGTNTTNYAVTHMRWDVSAIPLSTWNIFKRNEIGDDTFAVWNHPTNNVMSTMRIRFPGESYRSYGSVFRFEHLTITHQALIRVHNF